MANIFAIHSIGNSLITYLREAYPSQLDSRVMPNCGFELLSSGGLKSESSDESTRIGLYLYRISLSEHQRSPSVQRSLGAAVQPLGLDLHYLLTAWGTTPLDEQVPMAWAMGQLHASPLLDPSILSPEAAWNPEDIVQIVPTDLPLDELMRIWDTLDQPYHLSMSYVARVVRLETDPGNAVRPVVARRMAYGVQEAG